MTVYDLLILQLIAHLLADFTFQDKETVDEKYDKGFRSKMLKQHAIIFFLISWIISFQLLFVFGSIILTISHFVIDGFKKRFEKRAWGKYTFFFDQAWHIAIMIGVVILFSKLIGINPIIQMPFTSIHLLIIAGFLICTKPANVFIREVFQTYEISLNRVNNTENNEEIPNAGKLIGTIERILTLTLILFGQFGAVGFIIAGKSILRYREGDIPRTEYVLIGTLLSFGIAIFIGIGIKILESKLI